MSTLVTLPRSYFSTLSVGTLKQILWEARVRVPPSVIEKEELVERAWALVEEERRKDNEGLEDTDSDIDESDAWGSDHHHTTADGIYAEGDPGMMHQEHLSVPAMDSGLPPSRSATPQLSASPPASKPRHHPKPTSAERDGLCVVCQDEEASIAIVDCGYAITFCLIFPG